MNILFISALPVWSGENRAAGAPSFFKTLDAYAKYGHKVYLITCESFFTDNRISIVQVLKWFKKPRSKYINMVKLLPFFCTAAILAFLKFKDEVDFDIIYGYEVHGIFPAWFIHKIIKKPLVNRFQGTILYPILADYKNNIFNLIRKFDHFLAFRIKADLIIMTDDGTFGDLVISYINPKMKDKTLFLKNGVDEIDDYGSCDISKAEIKKTLGIETNGQVLMTLSRLENWKRIDRVISAMPNVIKVYPKIKLVIIGDGTERDSLSKLVYDLNVQKNVIFTGWIDNNQVKSYLKIADIFLSLYDLSNLGNPLLEAMQVGSAIITMSTGDVEKVIQHGYTGILLNDGASNTVSTAINTLLSNKEEILRYKKNTKVYAKNNFYSWKKRLSMEMEKVVKLNELDLK